MKDLPVMQMVVSGLCALFLGVGAARATPMEMTVDRLFEICEARSVEAAAAMGGALGWQRLTDAETEEWREGFVAHNEAPVELVGWRRKLAAGEESLSFWIASGPDGHKACAYSTPDPAGMLAPLTERLGEPDSLDRNDATETISAWWKRGERQYSLTRVGSATIVNIGPSR